MNFPKSLLITALILFSGFGILAQTPVAVAQAPDSETARLRLEAFDKVWNTVNENHYDPTFGGVDWNKVREDYLPKATAAKTEADFNGVLRQMLGELKLSHFGIFPKNLAAITAGNAGIGIEIKLIDGRPVVTRVEPGSTAEAAGVTNGSYIRKIGGTDVADLLKPLEASFAQRQLNDRLKMFYRQRTIEALVSGPADSKVTLELVDGSDKFRVVDIARKPFSGEMSQPMGFFPAQPVVFESKRLKGNIGYIRFNMWVIPQMAKIRAAMREFGDANGIIFDLRGNPGGVGGMATGVAGLVMDKQTSLGRMRMRSGSIDFVVYPQNSPFLGPIAILTDYGSGSTSEVFAAGMQETGRAKIVGGTTAGAVLPSVFATLPTGAIFQYVISDYRSPKNILVEGKGVTPDIKVEPDAKAILAGRDVQLEAAIKAINK
jgi:carboxyl-terminal processing protease